jgi:hypothetical protein
MDTLKRIGYILLSAIGLAAAAAVAILLAVLGASLGVVLLGGFLVVCVAVGLEEYFKETK